MLQQRSTIWVWQFFWLQCAALFLYVTFFLKEPRAAFSAALGALCYLILQFLFIRRVFAKVGAQHGRFILGSFYRTEALKLIGFAMCCYLCLQSETIVPMIFLGATIVAQSVYFWGRCLLGSRSGYCYE